MWGTCVTDRYTFSNRTRPTNHKRKLSLIRCSCLSQTMQQDDVIWFAKIPRGRPLSEEFAGFFHFFNFSFFVFLFFLAANAVCVHASRLTTQRAHWKGAWSYCCHRWVLQKIQMYVTLFCLSSTLPFLFIFTYYTHLWRRVFSRRDHAGRASRRRSHSMQLRVLATNYNVYIYIYIYFIII